MVPLLWFVVIVLYYVDRRDWFPLLIWVHVGIFIVYSGDGFIVCSIVVGRVRNRIKIIGVIVCGVIFDVGVIFIGGVVISDHIAPPICDFKSSGTSGVQS